MPENKASILIAESSGFSSKAAESLSQAGDLILADLDRPALLSSVSTVDVLWVRLRNHIDAEVMAAGERLKMIVTPTTGLDHVDLEEARRRGIRVLSLRGEIDFLEDVRATAEHTIALILALLRRVPAAVAHVKNGDWNRDLFKGSELCGMTIGVVGYGRLGRIVTRYLRAFDSRVLASDPHVDAVSAESDVTLVPLETLIREAHLVTLHVNLCDETRAFFGHEQFATMKKGAWFINSSRGELVNESALLEALGCGHLAGAAVDVVCNEASEGMANHPLVAYARQHDHLLITPHLGGCTVESMEKTERFLAERLLALLGEDNLLGTSRTSVSLSNNAACDEFDALWQNPRANRKER
jgi:D-3-phosphoglycerate dehydrogenase